MLEVEEEYSQFVQDGQNMLIPQGEIYVPGKVDLAVERKLSADILLENAQTVVLGGLTETSKAESETGIPILKDIPWIGKWLFGTVSQNEARKELLIFMTPYVLDEGEAAQLEALRRKKSLSDSRPWEDHGWSASNLADPVSKKEQMRRLKEEWAKQDEERQTKIAIEKMKVERAKKLKELSKEEREVWLKMHKEELEEEQQEELEKKMLDEKSQEDLKALVEKIKKDKLESAQKEIDKAEEMTRAENERAKLDAEKISK
jgi:type II secretory pathway component GspD/PulD (secretin)